MKKSDEYKNVIANYLVYYYQALISEGKSDPVREIVTEFCNMIEVTKEQKMFLLDNIKGMNLNTNDYIDNIVLILNKYQEDNKPIENDDIGMIIDFIKTLKKIIIIKK